MNNSFDILNPLEYEEWDNLILSHKDYNFFHSSAWIKVLYDSYKYNPLAFINTDNNQLNIAIPAMEISSIITGKRAVSLPFSDFLEPLLSPEYSFDLIKKEINDIGKKRKWQTFEIRGGNKFLGNSSNTFFYEHKLDISEGIDNVFSKFRSSTKRNINKAIKEGVSVKISNSFESVKDFYKLNCITRKRHGLPPQPFIFFKNIFNNIISQNKGFVASAYYNQDLLASAVYFHIGQKALYKYGASDLKHQQLRANNLVMWEAIKWFIDNGYQEFSFGRTEPENNGLRQFKNGWGTDEETIYYYKFDIITDKLIQESMKVSGWQTELFNKMPISILKIVGNLAYKHLG